MSTLLVRKPVAKPLDWNKQPETLAEALALLNIDPYTPKSVKKYKNKIARQCFCRSLPGHIPDVLGIICLISGLAPLIVGPIAGASYLFGWPFVAWEAVALIALPLVCITSGPLGFTLHERWAITKKHKIYTPYWRQFSYNSYRHWNKQVPEFVHATAAEITNLFPDATLMVEELDITVEDHSRPCDPFLVAQYGKEEYRVEVWNEPDFKKDWMKM